MDFFEDGKSPYEILGLELNPELTDTDIKKAYRTLSLILHPDKNRDNPDAAKQFQSLVKAYKVLSDASAKAALDEYLKAKRLQEERDRAKGEGRRKLREDLERRERQSTNERTKEDIAKIRLKEELDRIRFQMEQEAIERHTQSMAKAAAAAYAAAAATPSIMENKKSKVAPSGFPFPSSFSKSYSLIPDEGESVSTTTFSTTEGMWKRAREVSIQDGEVGNDSYHNDLSKAAKRVRPLDENNLNSNILSTDNSNVDSHNARHKDGDNDETDDLKRSLKVSWDPVIRDYSSSELREIFGRFGVVDGVVIKEQKKPRKSLALVMMAATDAAINAVNNVCGDLDMPLLVLPLLKVAPTRLGEARSRLEDAELGPSSRDNTITNTINNGNSDSIIGFKILDRVHSMNNTEANVLPVKVDPIMPTKSLFPVKPLFPPSTPLQRPILTSKIPSAGVFPSVRSDTTIKHSMNFKDQAPTSLGKAGGKVTSKFEEDLLIRMKRAAAAKKADVQNKQE
uniref:J domain-containing protein n=1 Tax=Polytomella parva TaxID=51329 RepID=A0A7S0Y9T0_9CHLO|mmetsp:Transcript_11718/g.21061  ORF Transcript_11718/g.21061 Transcript_11718/m.21061 type:complete len:510 (+) Transcript_11718:184-1713(+)|eukprot:CAMPEP_0175041154 /NCGR_PEP_ID=MMETSP0052_2-20121109/1746_1 /TAXON_ID=51329 ORGANISM="Polytomella parva, Strain SAG 63-3" /NCGR_SAMPLE_ID=MMETSP0052_2 /ASSEMBLY_ACC=CAM_ASM_000194 /LENGTH=509 /DNA_ID=CAMNT_0016303615 /DNA_START=62 /DNA_END=1591 /DNA_ORIENTATION=-